MIRIKNPNTSNKLETTNKKVLYPELSYKICGFCFAVHNKLGMFRSERSYADALENMFLEDKTSYKREYPLDTSFAGESDRRNIVDFLIENKIILEIKTVEAITKNEYYQVRRYLDSSGLELGILVNFRRKFIYPKRILNVSLYSKHLDKDS